MTMTVASRHHVEHVMGMAISIDIRDECPPIAVDEVVAWLHHVDDVFSTYKEDSEITALGRGEISLAEASAEMREVLVLCEEIRLQTDGAFDVFNVPAPNGTRVDPSGLVKGWAIEKAAGILEVRGSANFCLNAGGDVVLRGYRQGDTPWRTGVRHPEIHDAVALVIESPGPLAIATSATYERGDHIFDPRIERPATAIASATVVGPDLTLADAYATAVFVMGFDGLDWIEERPEYEAYLITHYGYTAWSQGFDRFREAPPVAE